MRSMDRNDRRSDRSGAHTEAARIRASSAPSARVTWGTQGQRQRAPERGLTNTGVACAVRSAARSPPTSKNRTGLSGRKVRRWAQREV